MSEKTDAEKTEQATPKRREEARKKGQVASSREISSVFVLFSSLMVFFFLGSHMHSKLIEMMRWLFQSCCSIELNVSSIMSLFVNVLKFFGVIMAPLMLVVLAAGIAGNCLQVGILFTGEPLIPKFSKLNPLSGAKKMLSVKSLGELVKSLLKLFIVGGVGFLMIRSQIKAIPCLVQMECEGVLLFLANVSFRICLFTCLALIIMAALDYAFQRWQYEKSLKMTKQEVKDETKQAEGDPALKGRIRSVQREMAQRRMMEEVPTADVIITNPTHLAIALKYNSEDMSAPRVVAKGAGFIAERIKEIAGNAGVPIVENKPLAQTLFKAIEVGDVIPVNLYRSVAEVLAYVYRLKRKQGAYS
jgi:flagellar biosynthetic protein FlhB